MSDSNSTSRTMWRPSGLTVAALFLLALIGVGVAFYSGFVPMQKRQDTVFAEAREREQSLPRVDVLTVGRAGPKTELKLPGTLQAITEAPILARTDGYLKRRLVDIGDRVQAGQVIAEIDAPELDQQIRAAEAAVEQSKAAVEQALANLEQGKANRDLARITAERYKSLADQGVAARQESDQYQAQFAAQTAGIAALEKAVNAQRSTVAANEANVVRLKELSDYRVVKAPFDGIVTVRNVDIGALVSTGSTVLYRLAQTQELRAYVNVPQVSAGAIHIGQVASLLVSNVPGRVFQGKVVRTSNALDPASRTLLVEVDVQNQKGELLPGSYADLDLSTTLPTSPLVIPAQAMIVRNNGPQVGVVDDQGIVHLRKITVGRDYGDRVEVLSGVSEGTTILASPGDTRDGEKVEAATGAGK